MNRVGSKSIRDEETCLVQAWVLNLNLLISFVAFLLLWLIDWPLWGDECWYCLHYAKYCFSLILGSIFYQLTNWSEVVGMLIVNFFPSLLSFYSLKKSSRLSSNEFSTMVIIFFTSKYISSLWNVPFLKHRVLILWI